MNRNRKRTGEKTIRDYDDGIYRLPWVGRDEWKMQKVEGKGLVVYESLACTGTCVSCTCV